MERIETQTKEVEEKFKIADTQLKEDNEAYENIKAEYEKKEQDMEEMDAKITEIREELSNTNVMKGKLEGQINVLNEQIKAAQMTDDSLKARLEQLESDRKERGGSGRQLRTVQSGQWRKRSYSGPVCIKLLRSR